MKLPEDYDENTGMTPAMVMTIVGVVLFIAGILVLVLLMNSDSKKVKRTVATQGNSPAEVSSPVILYPDTQELINGSNLHPDDLDFWDKYPEEKSPEPEITTTPEPEEVEEDPSTDGKHTLVQYADGKEEWVLISPYLPKHDYDFTKLVCQSDLMKYYEDGKQVSFVGVDVSKYHDYIDFSKVKKAGIDYVMIRAGVRGYGTGQLIPDDYFKDNLKRATDAGLDVGVYFYSQAITVEEAVEEAEFVIESLGDYNISYPIAYDMELVPNDTARTEVLSRAEKTEIAKAFMDTITDAGYKTILYGNKEWLIKEIDLSKLTGYDVWLSQQQDIPDFPYRFTMWQYSCQGSVDGIVGLVSLNVSFVDYSEK